MILFWHTARWQDSSRLQCEKWWKEGVKHGENDGDGGSERGEINLSGVCVLWAFYVRCLESALWCAGRVTRQEQRVKLQSAGLFPPVSLSHTWLCGRKHRLISSFMCLCVGVMKGLSMGGRKRWIGRKWEDRWWVSIIYSNCLVSERAKRAKTVTGILRPLRCLEHRLSLTQRHTHAHTDTNIQRHM